MKRITAMIVGAVALALGVAGTSVADAAQVLDLSSEGTRAPVGTKAVEYLVLGVGDAECVIAQEGVLTKNHVAADMLEWGAIIEEPQYCLEAGTAVVGKAKRATINSAGKFTLSTSGTTIEVPLSVASPGAGQGRCFYHVSKVEGKLTYPTITDVETAGTGKLAKYSGAFNLSSSPQCPSTAPLDGEVQIGNLEDESKFFEAELVAK